MPLEKEYVLGTANDEISRLGLQHRVWRSRALDAWRAAGISPGHTVLDLGCGPGYASLDLAELVGATGRVVAVDKSQRFLEALVSLARNRNLDNVTAHCADLDAGEFPEVTADVAWARWVFAFLKHPRDVLARMASALRPGGAIVLHEYFDYGTWRTMPRSPELEEYVAAVMASWRDNGGEPNIALSLPQWLEELGLEVRTAQPLIDVVRPSDAPWAWLRTFIEVGRRRLVDLGYLTAPHAEAIWSAFTKLEAAPGTRMISPGVLQIIAVRN